MGGEVRYKRSELAVKEGFGDGSARAFYTGELGIDETAFYIGIETTASHVGNGGEGASLDVERAAETAFLGGVGAEFGVGINVLVVVSEAFTAQESGIGNLHFLGFLLGGYEIGDLVITGTCGILVLL